MLGRGRGPGGGCSAAEVGVKADRRDCVSFCPLRVEVGRVSMSAVKPSVEKREAELIRRVCAGDKELFYELVRPCERALFTAAMAILNNPADAEEAAQEAVLKGLAALPRFRGEAKFSTWL